MAQSHAIAEFFARIGIKADTRQLDILLDQMKQLASYTKQLRSAMKNSFKVRADYGDLTKMRSALGAATGQVALLRAEINRLKGASVSANVSANVRQGVHGGRGGGGFGMGRGPVRFGLGAGMGMSAMLRAGLPSAAAGMFAVDSFNTAAQYQGIESALLSVTGSTKEAAKQFQWLHSEANRIGFVFKDNARTYTNFLAAGQSVGMETKQIQEIFQATAEYGRVLNLSADDLTGTFRALQQMLSKGTVQSEELKGQLGERLPGAVGLAARALGKSTKELFKMLENGEVLADDLLPKLAKEFKKAALAGGAFEKAQKNATAQLQRLNTAYDDFKVVFANSGFLEVVTDLIIQITKGFKQLEPTIRVVGTLIKILWQPFAALWNILMRVLDALSPLVPLLKVVGLYVLYITAPLWAVWAAFAALALIVDDFFSLLAGGDSVIGEHVAKGETWAHILLFILSFLNQIVKVAAYAIEVVGALFSLLTGDTSGLQKIIADAKAFLSGPEVQMAMPGVNAGLTGSPSAVSAFSQNKPTQASTTQQLTMSPVYNINGVTDPEEVARIVADHQMKMLTGASIDLLAVQ